MQHQIEYHLRFLRRLRKLVFTSQGLPCSWMVALSYYNIIGSRAFAIIIIGTAILGNDLWTRIECRYLSNYFYKFFFWKLDFTCQVSGYKVSKCYFLKPDTGNIQFSHFVSSESWVIDAKGPGKC